MKALLLLATALGLAVAPAAADEVSLQLGGRPVELSAPLRERLATLAREVLRRCGPNTTQQPGNFGLAAYGVEQRWQRLLGESRLRVVFAEPFVSESHLGGALGVSEALIGLEHPRLLVGPDLTRHGTAYVEHLECGYLASLELACLAELQPRLPARYSEACARLERDAQGRIVMPPPLIAPSCS